MLGSVRRFGAIGEGWRRGRPSRQPPPRLNVAMTYSQLGPRCGLDLAGDDKVLVADAVVEHALVAHRHSLDRKVVLAHLEGVHPHERDE